jgi:hypothetical protein
MALLPQRRTFLGGVPNPSEEATMSRSSNLVRGVMVLACASCDVLPDAGTEASSAALEAAPNPFGIAETFHTSGAIDRTNPFFQPLGTNPRTCETCHSPAQGWTITAAATAALFDATDGLAPLFNLVDEGSRPDADISTLEARRAAFDKTLLRLGLTRFSRTVPATSEFTVIEVIDPAGFATPTRLTAFRRSTPTANEAKVASTNWNAGPHDVPTQLFNTVSGAARLHGQRPDAVPAEMATAARNFHWAFSSPRSGTGSPGASTPRARWADPQTSRRSRSTSASTT